MENQPAPNVKPVHRPNVISDANPLDATDDGFDLDIRLELESLSGRTQRYKFGFTDSCVTCGGCTVGCSKGCTDTCATCGGCTVGCTKGCTSTCSCSCDNQCHSGSPACNPH